MVEKHNIITTDNNLGKYHIDSEIVKSLMPLANRTLSQLRDEEGNQLWIFPETGKHHNDKIDEDVVFYIDNNQLFTNNIMGFIGYNGSEINIKSRFSDIHQDDWFMQYMLQKVFSINIFKLDHSKNQNNVLDIAALLFPHFLQNAMKQGLYHEYSRRLYNDSHLRGAIDFNAHLKHNYPFVNGKIAYNTREHTFDNSVTQLIRHTIEFLRQEGTMFNIICATNETKEYIRQIIEATPTYRKGDLRKVMLANLNPRIHPYYSEYRPLQKLCLQILNREKLGYTEDSDKIHGVLFDGAWLWETYLNTLLTNAGFEHPDNKSKENPIHPFVGRNRKYDRYPDFMKDNFIADAKYKRAIVFNNKSQKYYDNIQRNDLNQIIAYMHIKGYKEGIFITPNDLPPISEISDSDEFKGFISANSGFFNYNVGTLNGEGGHISIIGLDIPKNCDSFETFVDQMKKNEFNLISYMKSL